MNIPGCQFVSPPADGCGAVLMHRSLLFHHLGRDGLCCVGGELRGNISNNIIPIILLGRTPKMRGIPEIPACGFLMFIIPRIGILV